MDSASRDAPFPVLVGLTRESGQVLICHLCDGSADGTVHKSRLNIQTLITIVLSDSLAVLHVGRTNARAESGHALTRLVKDALVTFRPLHYSIAATAKCELYSALVLYL